MCRWAYFFRAVLTARSLLPSLLVILPESAHSRWDLPNPLLTNPASQRKQRDDFGSEHTCVVFDDKSFLDLLPAVADALDEPLGDQALLPVHWLSRVAASHVKVVLSGEGADELFGGYFWYEPFASHAASRPTWRERLRGLLLEQRTPVGEVAREFFDAAHNITPSGFPLAGERYARVTVTGRAYDGTTPWAADVLEWLRTARTPLQRARAADLASWLPDDLLVKATA